MSCGGHFLFYALNDFFVFHVKCVKLKNEFIEFHCFENITLFQYFQQNMLKYKQKQSELSSFLNNVSILKLHLFHQFEKIGEPIYNRYVEISIQKKCKKIFENRICKIQNFQVMKSLMRYGESAKIQMNLFSTRVELRKRF